VGCQEDSYATTSGNISTETSYFVAFTTDRTRIRFRDPRSRNNLTQSTHYTIIPSANATSTSTTKPPKHRHRRHVESFFLRATNTSTPTSSSATTLHWTLPRTTLSYPSTTRVHRPDSSTGKWECKSERTARQTPDLPATTTRSIHGRPTANLQPRDDGLCERITTSTRTNAAGDRVYAQLFTCRTTILRLGSHEILFNGITRPINPHKHGSCITNPYTAANRHPNRSRKL
jgi:hypothetical protein